MWSGDLKMNKTLSLPSVSLQTSEEIEKKLDNCNYIRHLELSATFLEILLGPYKHKSQYCLTLLSKMTDPSVTNCLMYCQFSSVAQSCPTLCNPMNCSMPGLPVHYQLLEFTQTHIHWVGDAISHLILCCPLFLLPPIPSSIRVFSNESTLCMRWPKYWSFSFSISPSKEHPGLISFRMDWLDLLAVHETLRSLLQHHSSKASILQNSAFFTVQLSHPYMTTGKP